MAPRRVARTPREIDLRLRHGRSDGAVPELQHPDALGDLPRAVRRMRLHPSVLRGRSLQLSPIRRRRHPDHRDEAGAACRTCAEPPRARARHGRCDGSCEAYRAGSPCAADETSAPCWYLRSVNTPRHSGQGMSWTGCMSRTVRAESRHGPANRRDARRARDDGREPRNRRSRRSLGSPTGSGNRMAQRVSVRQDFRESVENFKGDGRSDRSGKGHG